MHFDTSVNLGNIITFFGFIFGLYQFNKSNISREMKMHEDNIKVLVAINTKLDIMWAWFSNSQIGAGRDQNRNT